GWICNVLPSLDLRNDALAGPGIRFGSDECEVRRPVLCASSLRRHDGTGGRTLAAAVLHHRGKTRAWLERHDLVIRRVRPMNPTFRTSRGHFLRFSSPMPG